tara:strand:- start:860 stop:1390 length:531 start_codon:yes stop_codon:yes gene_type:complete
LDKDQLENLISCDMSQRDLAEGLGVSQSNIRYWLKKHNLSTNNNQYNKGSRDSLPDRKICSKCKKDKPNSEFWKRNNRDYQFHSMCKDCNLKDKLSRQRTFKQECVDYKGGGCQCCGYNKCNNALDFHHIDPKTKKFGIAKQRRTKVTEEIKEELDKCALVCSNCHREIHAGVIKL